MSIHLERARNVAAKKNAAFGALSYEDAMRVGELSKRELIEMALHLAGLAQGCDAHDPLAYKRLMLEHTILKENDLI
jgi:hypothetical protein